MDQPAQSSSSDVPNSDSVSQPPYLCPASQTSRSEIDRLSLGYLEPFPAFDPEIVEQSTYQLAAPSTHPPTSSGQSSNFPRPSNQHNNRVNNRIRYRSNTLESSAFAPTISEEPASPSVTRPIHSDDSSNKHLLVPEQSTSTLQPINQQSPTYEISIRTRKRSHTFSSDVGPIHNSQYSHAPAIPSPGHFRPASPPEFTRQKAFQDSPIPFIERGGLHSRSSSGSSVTTVIYSPQNEAPPSSPRPESQPFFQRTSTVSSPPAAAPIPPPHRIFAQRRDIEALRRSISTLFDPRVIAKGTPHLASRSKMNYQNYIDSPGVGSGGNPRQAPPSPSQGMNHANGMNGGMGMGGGMIGYPTPAGHQSDLNYVMSMVEELSQVLRANQQLTAGVVEKMGKVREKAQHLNLTNDELIAAVAAEMNEDSMNLEKENSELRKALEKSEYDKKENFKLACHGANILADITEKMHRFKEQHELDTLAWHKNYRKQLADEREENLNLRNQINDMKAAACRANESLRQMRRFITDNDEWHKLRVENIAFRQEKRFWKRLALPLIPDDDSEWSDDDDLEDPEVKKRRLAALQAEKERKDKEDARDEGAPNP